MSIRFARAAAVSALVTGAAVAAGVIYQHVGSSRDHRRFPPPGTLVEVGARKLFLRCVGEGLPIVVLLSGGGTPAVASFALQDRIAVSTRTCSYDRAGLGWSDPVAGRRSIADATDDLQALLANAKIDGPVILVPESFGALIAAAYIARAPDRVAGAVFVDGSEPALWFRIAAQDVPSWKLHNLWWQPAVDLGLVRALFPYAAPDWVRRLPHARFDLFRSVYSRPAKGYAESADAFEATAVPDRPVVAPGALGSKPLIVLEHGRPSAMLAPVWEGGWPAAQRRLATLSTRGKLVVVPDTGHAMAGENPAAVAAAVRIVIVEARRSPLPPTLPPATTLP